jgi:hypothetical protein
MRRIGKIGQDSNYAPSSFLSFPFCQFLQDREDRKDRAG